MGEEDELERMTLVAICAAVAFLIILIAVLTCGMYCAIRAESRYYASVAEAGTSICEKSV